MQEKVWKTVAKKIAHQVTSGKWAVGTIIPTEMQLAEKYQVSRDTIRKALKLLTESGLFERKPHVGTRVKARVQSGKFVDEISDIKAIDKYGNQYPRKILDVTDAALSEEEAKRLGLPYGQPYIRFTNIRTVSETIETPVVVTYVYITPECSSIIEDAKKYPDELIATLLEARSGVECTEVRQTFSATAMNAQTAAYFNVPEGGAALRIIRTYLDRKGKVMEVSESFHPADRFSFTVSARKKPHTLSNTF